MTIKWEIKNIANADLTKAVEKMVAVNRSTWPRSAEEVMFKLVGDDRIYTSMGRGHYSYDVRKSAQRKQRVFAKLLGIKFDDVKDAAAKQKAEQVESRSRDQMDEILSIMRAQGFSIEDIEHAAS